MGHSVYSWFCYISTQNSQKETNESWKLAKVSSTTFYSLAGAHNTFGMSPESNNNNTDNNF